MKIEDVGERIGIATVFAIGVLLGRMTPGWSLDGLLFGYGVTVIVIVVNAMRKRGAPPYYTFDDGIGERRGEQLNGEFFNADDRDTRGRGVVK